MGRNVKGGGIDAPGEAAGNGGEVIKIIEASEGDAARLLEMY